MLLHTFVERNDLLLSIFKLRICTQPQRANIRLITSRRGAAVLNAFTIAERLHDRQNQRLPQTHPRTKLFNFKLWMPTFIIKNKCEKFFFVLPNLTYDCENVTYIFSSFASRTRLFHLYAFFFVFHSYHLFIFIMCIRFTEKSMRRHRVNGKLKRVFLYISRLLLWTQISLNFD